MNVCIIRFPADADSPPYWDLVIGADVVWLEHLVPPLVQAIATCMSDLSTLYLAHQVDTIMIMLTSESNNYMYVCRSEVSGPMLCYSRCWRNISRSRRWTMHCVYPFFHINT